MTVPAYETFAWLVVTEFKHSPDEVTRVVGLAPSDCYSKGDPWRGTAKRFTSAWVLNSPAGKTEPLESVLSALLDTLETAKAGVLEAGRKFSTQIGVAAYFRESLPVLNLSKELVQRIAQLECSLDIDTYYLGED